MGLDKMIISKRFLLILGMFLLGISIFLTRYFIGQASVEVLTQNSKQELEQFIGHLEARLDRFQDIPQLIAKNEQLIDLLENTDNISQKHKVNQFLAEVNKIIGASDTYLMDREGLTLASSNWQKKRTFVGRNFSFRPYFIDALKGKLGRYFALGTTSGKRGYYFSYPVATKSNIIGVIVVKMNLANVEQIWAQRDINFMVTDQYGVVLITTKPEWLYMGLYSIEETIRKRLLDSKQYGTKYIGQLDYTILEPINDDHQRIQLGADKSNQYLVINQEMLKTLWTVKVFAPLKAVGLAQRNAIIVLLLVWSVFLLIFYLARQKQKRREEKILDQLKAQQNLEHEVAVRTADLSREIEQHKQTELLLKETQKELIQTAKLAVLGEMSASISHELNNPLAAIRSYTDNARKFVTLNKTQQIDDNLIRISRLTERMGKISSQLKLFARKSSGTLEEVDLKKVVQSAIDISSPHFKNLDVSINIDRVDPNLLVKANNIQLEQVIINLLNNAMFAIGVQSGGLVSVMSETTSKDVVIHIDDNGPGVDQKDVTKIFDPFYTTKKSGMGLGLSISARILDGFGGHLSVVNLLPHGARFTMTLLKLKK